VTDSAADMAPTPLTHSAEYSVWQRMWQRKLEHYPTNGRRTVYLAIVVLATIVLYYQLYVQGAVATKILVDFNMSLRYFTIVLVIGNGLGAFASLAAGLADRWGRANLVTYGLLLTGLIVLFGMPNAGSKLGYLIWFSLLGIVEGVLLVATPALIRDFSPQIGRASAMGFWTLGPVVGSLVVTEVSSHTLDSHPDWRYQFYIAGIVGLVIFVVALFGLRELSPRLRDQLMVSAADQALIEARAEGKDLDIEDLTQGLWKQMARPRIFFSSLGISLFLIFYYMSVAFFVVYFATTFGYSEARANSLANWYWISNALALIIVGALSDWVRVRKPFMIVGGVISAIATAIFAVWATHPEITYYNFAVLSIFIASAGGMAYCCWMAAFTETVEDINPAGTATGLAIWGWVLRMVVMVSFLAFTFVVNAANPLVDHGTQLQALQAKYPQLAATNAVDIATLKALTANANDTNAQFTAVSEIAGNGITATDVSRANGLNAKFPNELATAQAIDPQTSAALAANASDTAAITKATSEVAAKFNISSGDALTKLLALSAVPKDDLKFLSTIPPGTTQNLGTQINAAAADLQFVQKLPPAEAALVAKYAVEVRQAQVDAPKQWQKWWWVCFAGQVLFLPLVFLLRGRWSPKKAKQDFELHEELVRSEMAKLPTATAGQT
jgi:ACS family D-galactonate transporter-like MFS transporter